ncbi:hypothetical protein RchiOBHm_Chr4g0429801 [Rosa chinensis]|uniref:Uncharacterized protein n=1 Tax=Rosa chinensis TaxID=74649 RepID=A0A2P6R093_ROSCH|nr:hypothetical protein RchiOBHm_Chr4g0429801 [Rosa chinensis]
MLPDSSTSSHLIVAFVFLGIESGPKSKLCCLHNFMHKWYSRILKTRNQITTYLHCVPFNEFFFFLLTTPIS